MRATLAGSLLTVAMLTTQTGWAATLTFQDYQVIDTSTISGFTPKAITSADFDSPSSTDIAVTDTGNDKLVVLPGNGDATFGAATSNTSTGTSPDSVASADLDGGSGTDLVTANSGSNTLSVFLNNGSGSFTNTTNPTTGNTPVFVLVADLDGDTDNDLVSINKGDSTLSIFINDGIGGFSTTADATISDSHLSTPVGAVAVDLDGGTGLDLAVISQGNNSISVFLNDGSGNFTYNASYSSTTGVTPYAIAAGNLNANILPELVVSNSDDDTITVYTNGGSSFTKTIYNTLSTPHGVVLDDMDQDGDLDIAVADNGADLLSVFENDGIKSGTFPNRVDFSAVQGPSGLATGDLDNDAYPELLVTNLTNAKVSYLENLTPITPDTFTFANVANASLGSTVKSETVTITGLATSAPISIDAKAVYDPVTQTNIYDAKYSINGGIFTADPGTISNGDTVQIQLSIGTDAESSVTKTLTIGGLSVTFTVTTTGDTVPNTFTIIPVVDATPGATVVSTPVTITGLGGPATVLISNGEYSIAGGAFTSNSGTISNGQTLEVRLAASSNYGSTRSALVSVGGIQAAFIVTTKSGSSSSSGGGGGSFSPWLLVPACLWRRKN
jgi:hypothetical protein